MESHNHQKHQNHQQPLQQKQPLDIQQQRQAEHNLPLECTEEIAIQHPEQNPNPCLDNQRMKGTGFPLGLLIQTIIPHLHKSNVMLLQLHHTKLKRNEINRTDFVRLVRKIAGQQLFQWGLENIKLQRHIQPSSLTMPPGAGINVDMSTKKRSTDQREPLEALHNHYLSPPWKKKKVSGAIPEQSIRELDRETASSGVNIREEKQISSGHKEELWTSETAQHDVLKEERMILQKIPLQRKLAEIISKYGITYISNSVERCLSMCVEGKMRVIITNLIKMSKMRVDPEVPVHQKSIMSDVRLQILMINRKAKEVDKKQQAEKDIMLQKLDETNKLAEDSIQITPTVALQTFVEKDDMLLKLQLLAEQARQKHDWRISAASKAANIAVRTAVGGEDLLVKWQLMAEQAREKCQGGVPEDACQAALSTSRRPSCYSEEPENTMSFSALTTSSSLRKSGRPLSVRDVIASLERETHMSKSTLLYRFYEKRVC